MNIVFLLRSLPFFFLENDYFLKITRLQILCSEKDLKNNNQI